MIIIEDFVARTTGTCGKGETVIVTFKQDRRKEAISKILRKAQVNKSMSQMIFDLSFGNVSFRLYESGKAIFSNIKDKEELNAILIQLLS